MRTLSALIILSLVPSTLGAQAGIFYDKPNPKPASQSAQGEDAISQLEAMTGQKIDRSKVGTTFTVRKPPPPPPPKPVKRQLTTSQQATATLVGGLFGALLNQALQPSGPSGPSPEELARLEAERQEALRREQVELQAWANAYSSRMNALVDHQRQQRGAQNQESLEGLRASLSDGWDSGQPPMAGGLAGALSDPVPIVDLRESRTLTPSLLREANGRKRATPVTADDLLKRREAAQARLKTMMAENKDLRVLGQRFYELEAELDRLKRQATSLGTEGRAIQHDMDFWGWRVEQATQACMERGTSLFTDVLLPAGTKAGLQHLQKNPKLWNQTMQSFNDLNEFTEFTTNLADRYDAAGRALDWVQAKRNLMKDVDFIASNLQFASKKFEPLGLHWQVGKDIVGTGVDLAAELDGWGAVLERQGDIPLNRQKQQMILARMEPVIRNLQISRAQIAARLGVRPEDLIPVPEGARGLGSNVPPI